MLLFWRFWAAHRAFLLWLLIVFSLLLVSVPASPSLCFLLRPRLSLLRVNKFALGRGPSREFTRIEAEVAGSP